MKQQKQHKKMQIFRFIRHYWFQYDCSPTQYEIAKALQVPRSTVYHYIQHLVKDQLIKVTHGIKRGIEMIEPKQYMRLPIVGYIWAGKPIETLVKEEVLNLADLMLGSDRYVLQVKGDSMIGDNICDGDFIICERCDKAEGNQIAVVLVDDKEVTLKRLAYHNDEKVRLISSNPQIEPMEYGKHEIKVQGIYLGLIRFSDVMQMPQEN